MTDKQKNQIKTLRNDGHGYTTIANMIGLKKDTVVAFCRRNGLTGTMARKHPAEMDSDCCPQCRKLLIQKPGKKRIRFCSPTCRQTWWNAHPEAVKRRAVYTFNCAHCGTAFSAYGNSKRKYCSHSCYISARYKGGESHE